MPLRLYNTRTRSVEPFRPLHGERVHVYVCGLTPSAEGHVGHARSFLFFDVLRRYLEHPRNGFQVTFVKNVTDIDDRSIATAQREGTTYDRIVARYYDSFTQSMERLGVRPADREPFATKAIPEIQLMIDRLVESGHAYASRDGIYFGVETFADYGKLSGKKVDELLIGARIEENEDKRNPLDFALWKFAREGEPAWPWRAGSPNDGTSAWAGRPGWHIECSAMIADEFGMETIDVHGGGYDLVFPHHENEIAQSESLMPQQPQPRLLANFWLHGGLLNFDGRKMSKSLGNFEPLSALLDRHDPFAIRLLFLQTGYRKPMNFTEDSIGAATTALRRLQAAAAELRRPPQVASEGAREAPDKEPQQLRDAFFAALDDDMDTSRAAATLFYVATRAKGYVAAGKGVETLAFVREAAAILGIGPAFADDVLDRTSAEPPERLLPADLPRRLSARLGDALHLNGESPEAAIQAVIDARTAARKNKDFALGDRLRDALAAEGIALKDSKDGTTWTAAGE